MKSVNVDLTPIAPRRQTIPTAPMEEEHSISSNDSAERERKHIQNEKLKNEWIVCGNKTDSHLIKYASQMVIGASVLAFCFIQISKEAENKEIYFSLISGILGSFLNSPSPRKNMS